MHAVKFFARRVVKYDVARECACVCVCVFRVEHFESNSCGVISPFLSENIIWTISVIFPRSILILTYVFISIYTMYVYVRIYIVQIWV